MFKKILKYTIFILFCIVDLYALYATIGYIVLGSKAPVLYNGGTSYFMGMYFMSITFGVIFLILTTILIVLYVKHRKKLKEYKKSLQYWVPTKK